MLVAPIFLGPACAWLRDRCGWHPFPREDLAFAISVVTEGGEVAGVCLGERDGQDVVVHVALEAGIPERAASPPLRRAAQQAMVALGYGRHKVGKGSLGLRPIRIAEAQEYMLGGSRSIHRHHEKSQGGLYALSVVRGEPAGERVVAVAVVGRPVARKLQNSEPGTIEVIRLASDGTPHAPSMLLGAVERAARALGWRSLITYTLPSESGASLRAASWQVDRESAGGGHWGTVARPRVTKHPVDLKVRWRKALRTESAPTRPGAPRHATRSPFDAPWWSETGLDLFDVFDLADEVT